MKKTRKRTKKKRKKSQKKNHDQKVAGMHAVLFQKLADRAVRQRDVEKVILQANTTREEKTDGKNTIT